MRYLLLLLLPFTFFLSPSSLAHASESALSASPAILEAVLDLKKPTETTLSIQNNTNFPLPIKGSSSAFLATETIREKDKDTFNASRWISLEPSDFILQPNELKQVKVKINPPKDAEPGGHYATIYFRPLIPEDAVSRGGNVSLARIGILAMMIVPGDISPELTQSPLSAPSWSSFGPIKFWSNLTNEGSIHLLPSSTLTIKNIWGHVVAELKPEPSLVLPHTTKEHNFIWEKKLGLGPYKATLTTNYATDQKPLISNTVTTYLLPWPLILGAFIILTIIYKIFIVNRRRLVLAIQVLTGKYEVSTTTQKNSRNHPGAQSRPRTSITSKPARQSARS